MSRFIESFSTHQLLPPWQSKGLRMWSFVIKVERTCIQDHLDSHFNSAGPDLAPYRYEAMAGPTYGMLCVAMHPDFSSVQQGIAGWDTTSHTELYWSFPVWRSRVTADNLLVERTLVWIQPFAFDDNSYVMFSAREIWGTEMDMAQIFLSEGQSPGELHVDMAIEGLITFNPQSHSHQIGCLRIRMQPETSDAQLLDLLTKDPDLNTFVQVLVEAGIFTQGVGGPAESTRTGMLVNTLKQFRDVFDMDVAAYRALVESRTQHSGIANMAIYAGKDAVLEFMASDSMAETLVRMFGERPRNAQSQLGTPPGFGLDSHGQTIDWDMPNMPVDVAMVISYTADARFDVEGILHTYGQSG